MKKSLLVLTVLLVAALLVTGLSGCAAGQKEKVVKVAFMWPMSGVAASWGFLGEKSMLIAKDDINNGGGIKIKGDSYKLEVIVYDHQYDPSIAQTLARKAIYDDKVVAIHVTDDLLIGAITEINNKGKILAIGMQGGTVAIGPEYPYNWKVYYNGVDNMDVVFEYLAQRYPGARLADVQTDSEEGHERVQLGKEMSAQYGLGWAGEAFLGEEVTDFYPMLTGLLKNKIDFINIGSMPPERTGTLIKQAVELGYKGKFLDSVGGEFEGFAKICGWGPLEGALSGGSFAEMPTQIGKSWKERFVQSIAGEPYAPWAGYTYDGILAIKYAVEAANSLDPEKINQAMEGIQFDGVFGPVSFGGEDLVGIKRILNHKVNVMEVKGGKLVDVYLEYPSRLRK